MKRTTLSHSEQADLKQDGFVILRDVIPLDFVTRAREIIQEGMPVSERRLLAPAELATHPEVMRAAMGPYPDVVSCQIAITPGHNNMWGHPEAHVDGSWGGAIPTSAEEIDIERGRPLYPIPYFGENDEKRGTNDGTLWQDPNRRISLGSYTALVGIALNDQMTPGNGQFGVLKGMHEEVERGFRMQRDSHAFAFRKNPADLI